MNENNEHGSPVARLDPDRQHGARLHELSSLRSEILIRVVFQNAILCVLACVFAATLVGFTLTGLPELLAVYAILTTIAAGMWAHHGSRQVQIREYLHNELEPALFGRTSGGWENWLKVSRFDSVLGSRWFVSTKGVFLGSEAIALLLLLDPRIRVSWVAIAVAISAIVSSIWLLREARLRTQ